LTKGTASMGKRSAKKTHIRCRRCGRHSYHVRGVCASCGFGASAKRRNYNWAKAH
jgi:large subunit ribosomal protein L37e